MKHILGATKRTITGSVAALFLLSVVAVSLPAQKVSAAGLLYRSLQLSSSAPGDVTPIGSGDEAALAGSAANGQKVSHTYVFQTRSTTPILGMSFQFCDDPFGYVSSCTTPDGFTAADAPSAVVYKSNGGDWANGITYEASGTTFTVQNPTAGKIEVVNATGVTPGSTIATGQFVKVVFEATDSDFFRNPDADYVNNVGSPNESQSFFVRINTFDDDPATLIAGDLIDEGTVTSSIANTISINTRVQETLKFSVGGFAGNSGSTPGTANDPVGDSACEPLSTAPTPQQEGALTMGDTNLSLSAATVSKAKSYVRLATNSSRGAQVLYAGQPLKSTAGDTIEGVSSQDPMSTAGSAEQFGLAVLDTGSETHAVNTDLVSETAYDATGGYNFSSTANTVPVKIAESPDVVACDTLAIEYAANITNETPAGLYSTKISYIAVPSY